MRNCEYLRNPVLDPLKMFRGLDVPDQRHTSGRNRGWISSRELDEVSDVRELVSDADAGGKKENGAVRVERLFEA